MMLRQCERLEYVVGLPPPVVLHLSKLGISVEAVEVREVCIRALEEIGPEINYL